MLVKHTCGSKLQTLGMRYPFTLPVCRSISHRNGWSFRVYISCYMIPLRDFVPDVVNSRRGDSRRHDILWWYHVNKYRAMRGNRSELAPGRKSPRCHVNTHIASSWESAITHFDFDLFIREQWTFKRKGMLECTLITYHRILLCNRVLVIFCTLIVVRVSINLLDYLNGVFPAGEPNWNTMGLGFLCPTIPTAPVASFPKGKNREKDSFSHFFSKGTGLCTSGWTAWKGRRVSGVTGGLSKLFRERLSEKMCTRQSRKVIWDKINTAFLTL